MGRSLWSRRGLMLAAGSVSLGLAGCHGKRVPIRTVSYAPGAPRKRLLVMLPGLGDRAEVFERRAMIEPVRDSGLGADVIAVNAQIGYYRDRSVVPRIREDVILPARAAGYEEVWMLGVSLGGFGSLLTASRHPELVDGLFIMAPYLGPGEPLEEIRGAGGLSSWKRDASRKGYEWDLWDWLSGYARDEERPPLLLGFGDRDDGNGSKQLVADVLPDEHVFVRTGGHKWAVWQGIWPEMLGRVQG